MVQKEKAKHNSFLLYKDHRPLIDCLSNEDAGKLIKALFEYACTGEKTELEGPLYGTFSVMAEIIKRNDEAYKATCEKNRENGKKGGRPKKSQKNRPVIFENRTKAKKADNDNDNDNDNDSISRKNRRFSFNSFPQNKYDFAQLEREFNADGSGDPGRDPPTADRPAEDP